MLSLLFLSSASEQRREGFMRRQHVDNMMCSFATIVGIRWLYNRSHRGCDNGEFGFGLTNGRLFLGGVGRTCFGIKSRKSSAWRYLSATKVLGGGKI